MIIMVALFILSIILFCIVIDEFRRNKELNMALILSLFTAGFTIGIGISLVSPSFTNFIFSISSLWEGRDYVAMGVSLGIWTTVCGIVTTIEKGCIKSTHEEAQHTREVQITITQTSTIKYRFRS